MFEKPVYILQCGLSVIGIIVVGLVLCGFIGALWMKWRMMRDD